MSPTPTLFPRLHLFEIEDQPWCPHFLRVHSHTALRRMWSTSNTARGTPASQACHLLLSLLAGPRIASTFTFIDACAGSGGPTPLLEREMNTVLRGAGYKPVKFVLTDLWPDVEAWEGIKAGSEHVDFVREPVNAMEGKRIVGKEGRECRVFNLCFHHFMDEEGGRVLKGAVEGGEAFMIFEMTHRTLPSLLNTTIVILSCLLTTVVDYWWSPMHLVFTYLIPVVPLFYMVDGYVSCTRGRTAEETWALLRKQTDVDLDDWELSSGEQTALWPFGRLYWYGGVEKSVKYS
ncbi:hypothetical protein BDZ85DRAFT_304374 [Elsinoe ampelina]|uniref:Methyltransferase domain-containing protein n=1 Tax=Elsinoe ampelina TaxID=302913 RepID=A0A6A6G2G7_9PEZI|nr:hypothetical protein BDZ85DRAFT_304374 [Elsinoe ampelina]